MYIFIYLFICLFMRLFFLFFVYIYIYAYVYVHVFSIYMYVFVQLGYTMQRSLCGKRRLAEYLMKKPRYKIISSIMQVCKDSSKASAEGKPPFCCANAVS